MAELVAGIKHIRDGIEAQTVLGADMSTVGIVGTAPNADAEIYPLNTPILVKTNESAMRTALGDGGTIEDALVGLSAQVGQNAKAVRCVVVRVEDDADPFTVIGNIVGNEGNQTGMWALLNAPEELAVTPRLLIAPGYTSQSQSGIADPVITAPGSGGTDGTFALAFTGGTGSGAAGEFTVTSGAITSISITNRGVYTVAPTFDFSASANLTGQTVNCTLEQLANAVCAAMPTICDRLRGNFIPEGPTDTRQNYLDWLETLPQSMRVFHPLHQDVKVQEGETVVSKPASPYIAGLYVRRDSESDGIPSKSAANQQIYGILGVTPSIPFSIIDESSEGQEFLTFSAGIMFRGELGFDGALTDGGFGFWGTDTMSIETEWLFSNVVRMRDYLELMQVKALRIYLGRYNITTQTVQAVVNTIESAASRLRSDNHLLDYRVSFDPDANLPEELRLGNLDLTFEGEEPPVLRKIIIRSRRHREALETLVRNIAIQLGTEVAA